VPNYFGGYPWEPNVRDFSTWISYKLRSKYNNSFIILVETIEERVLFKQRCYLEV
jgi:hypothetical protein